jgi:PEP-CTERM motif
MKRAILRTLAVLATFALVSAPAFAQVVINLNTSTSGYVYFSTPGASQPIDLCTTSSTSSCVSAPMSGGVTFNSSVDGHYTITMSGDNLSNFSLGSFTFNQPGGSTTQLTWTDGSGNELIADLIITGVTDGTTTPRFNGTLGNISFGAGTQQSFKDLFSAGGIFDWNLRSVNPTLEALWNGTATSTYGNLSSGEIDTPVPEPASMLLLGAGLLGLGFLRRKLGNSA